MNPSKTKIKKILSSCAFDLKKHPLLHSALTCGNSNYFEMRASELIMESRLTESCKTEKLRYAIFLLSASIALREEKENENG